jgi:CHAD domain-containing protein
METPELSLTERERSTLDALTTDLSIRARRRALILLAWADGKSHSDIRHELKTRSAQIHRVVTEFNAKRLESLSAAAIRRVEKKPRPKSRHSMPDLTSQSSMRAAAHHILAQQFAKASQVESGVRAGTDVEAVHDMRVAFRRLNSALRLFKPYLPNKRAKKIRGVMEQLRDLLGAARNLDVLLQDLHAYQAQAPVQESEQLEKIAVAWRTGRAGQQTALTALLDSPDYQTWRDRMDAFLEATDDDAPRVSDVLPALVWKQYGAVRAYETHLDSATLQDLHALRIDIKRLRYTLEFFADAFTEKPKTLIEPLVTLQDHLGSIQDAVVAGQALTDAIIVEAEAAKSSGTPLSDFQAIGNYHAHLQTCITDLRAALPQKWDCIIQSSFREQLGQVVARL